MFIIAGYSLAMMMGLTLGLIGAGGSILTVPILVYLFGVKPVVATAYSLLIVGCSAMAGTLSYWKNRQVYFKEAFAFAIPAMTSVWMTRSWVVPAIPESILGFPKDSFIMILFSLMMLSAAIAMFLKKSDKPEEHHHFSKKQAPGLILGSIAVGFLTGLVGAGGGFLIIPSLIAIFGFGMKEAVGTSLAIITINSLVGFNGDLRLGLTVDWYLLGAFLLLTLFGVISGSLLSRQIDAKKIKSFFATFTLLLGFIILFHEIGSNI